MKFLLVVMACAGCASATTGEGEPHASHEVVSATGRIKGHGMRMDVSIGHTFAQRPVKGTGVIVKTASPVAR